jgi:hypothetical protein
MLLLPPLLLLLLLLLSILVNAAMSWVCCLRQSWRRPTGHIHTGDWLMQQAS